MKVKIILTDIHWDVEEGDEEGLSLPSQMEVQIKIKEDWSKNEIDEYAIERATSITGYCILQACVKVEERE